MTCMLQDETQWGEYHRRVFDDHVQWIPSWVKMEDCVDYWTFSVHKYPFVPGYHLAHYPVEDSVNDDYVVVSTHKTLAEAMGILNVLLRNGGVVYY